MIAAASATHSPALSMSMSMRSAAMASRRLDSSGVMTSCTWQGYKPGAQPGPIAASNGALDSLPRMEDRPSRRLSAAGWFLEAAAAWTSFVWITRIRNLATDDRSFLVIHYVIAGVSLAFAAGLAKIGLRLIREG